MLLQRLPAWQLVAAGFAAAAAASLRALLMYAAMVAALWCARRKARMLAAEGGATACCCYCCLQHYGWCAHAVSAPGIALHKAKGAADDLGTLDAAQQC
jgi:hypothetical protein